MPQGCKPYFLIIIILVFKNNKIGNSGK